MREKAIVYASGDATGGGSGFRELVENTLTGVLDLEIVCVVSNHENGGVRQLAKETGIPFVHFTGPWTGENYRKLRKLVDAKWTLLSGWLFPLRGEDPCTSVNIHPGWLPRFGGRGMYGHHVHEATIQAFRKGKVAKSAVTMHFVTDFDEPDDYDKGPVFFEYPVLIHASDTPKSLGARVNKIEHGWQPYITNLVVQGKIYWDGRDSKSLVVPPEYPFLPA